MRTTLHRQPDRAPRGSALPARPRRICRRSRARGRAARGDPAQLGRARPHPSRSTSRRRCARPGVHAVITADGHRRTRAAHPDAAAAAAGVRAVRAAGDRATTRCAMSASRSRSCWPTAPRIAEDALGAIEVDIEPLPAVADRAAAAQDASAAVRGRPAPTVAVTFHAVRGDAAAAFANAPYVRRESFRTQRHTALPMEPRGVLARVGCGTRAGSRSRAPPRCRSSTGASSPSRSGLPKTPSR